MPINCQYLEKLSVSGKLGRAWGVSRLSFSGWIQIELMVMTLSASVQSLCPAKHLIRKVSEPPKVKESLKVKQRIIAMSCYIRKFANSLTIISLRGVKYKPYQSLLPKHSPPHSSLSQVCQTQSRVAKSGYTGSSIHSESGHQPPTMSPSLSVFFFFCLASPRCDKTVDRWVCRCVHWSTMTGGLWACCLETVSWQAWQGGPAAPQADKGQAKPGAQVAWLRRGRRLQCIVKLFLNKKRIPAALRIYHVCIYLSAGTQQTLSQRTRFFARRKDRQRTKDSGWSRISVEKGTQWG